MQKVFRRIFNNFREYIIAALLLIISLSLLSVNDKPQIKKLRAFAFAGFAFLNSVIDEAGSIFTDESELMEQKKINAKLMLELNKLREYGLENEELKHLLKIKDTTEFPLIAATVISKLVSNTHGNFIINVGYEDSVKIGMPLINEKGLIGFVNLVTENFSLARNLHNRMLKLAVKNERSRIDAIMNWDGKNLVLKNVPTTFDMQVGDRIITSGVSTIVPPKIPVGVITKRKTSVAGLLSDIIIEPYVHLSAVKNLFVLGVVRNPQIDSLEINLLKER